MGDDHRAHPMRSVGEQRPRAQHIAGPIDFFDFFPTIVVRQARLAATAEDEENGIAGFAAAENGRAFRVFGDGAVGEEPFECAGREQGEQWVRRGSVEFEGASGGAGG